MISIHALFSWTKKLLSNTTSNNTAFQSSFSSLERRSKAYRSFWICSTSAVSKLHAQNLKNIVDVLLRAKGRRFLGKSTQFGKLQQSMP